MNTLHRGSTGAEVLRWQQFLNAHAYDCGKADGAFGLRTEKATQQFQRALSLEPDGIVGPSTFGAARVLDATLSPMPTPDPVPATQTGDLSLRKNAWPREADAAAFFGYPSDLTRVKPPFSMKTSDGGRWYPVPHIVCNVKVAPSITRILASVFSEYGRDEDKIAAAGMNVFDGCYNDRNVRGSSTKKSMHALGAAMDWNSDLWPLHSERRMPEPVFAIYRAEGWRNGADYTGRKDPMHWEACR